MPYRVSVGGSKGEKLGKNFKATKTGEKFAGKPAVRNNPFLARGRHGKPHGGVNFPEYVFSMKTRRFIPDS